MSIKRFLSTPATWYPKTGYNKFGRDISSNATVPTMVRFENRTVTRKNKQGQVVQYLGKLFMDPSLNIQTEDRVQIGSLSYKIATVNGDIDLRGNQRLIECEVEKWVQA